MIVNHLSRELGARRMSALELHRLTGIPYSSLHKLVRGQATRYDAATLDRICRVLGCAVGDILEYVPG